MSENKQLSTIGSDFDKSEGSGDDLKLFINDFGSFK
jgi:hypothetical protein